MIFPIQRAKRFLSAEIKKRLNTGDKLTTRVGQRNRVSVNTRSTCCNLVLNVSYYNRVLRGSAADFFRLRQQQSPEYFHLLLFQRKHKRSLGFCKLMPRSGLSRILNFSSILLRHHHGTEKEDFKGTLRATQC